MIGNTQSLEWLILTELKKKSRTGVELVSLLEKKRKGTTKQGVYRVLRVLTQQEIVVVSKKEYLLARTWVDKMAQFFVSAQKDSAHTVVPEQNFLLLSDGDSITYTFKNPIATDNFWNHAIHLLLDVQSKNVPVCFYNPHNWFLFAHRESEQSLLKTLLRKKCALRVLNGTRDPMDVFVKKFFTNEQLQYFAAPKSIFKKRNYYLSVFGDFQIEVWLDATIQKKIDEWYAHTTTETKESLLELQKIVLAKGKTKMKISRDSKRGITLLKIFARYF